MLLHQAAFLVHVALSSVNGRSPASGVALMVHAQHKPKTDQEATQLKQPKSQPAGQIMETHPHPGARHLHGEAHVNRQ